MDKIYQTLLTAVEEFQQPQTTKKVVHKISRVPFGKLREPLIKAVKAGKVTDVQQLINEHPHIKETGYWQDTVARLAVEHEQVPVLKYLLDNGAGLKRKNRTDHIWSIAVVRNNVELFKFLWDRKIIDWNRAIDSSPYLLGYAVKSPAITRIMMDAHGVDLGFSKLIVKQNAGQTNPVIDQGKATSHEYIAQNLVAGIIALTVESPELFPRQQIMTDLQSTLLVKQYPEIEERAAKIIWEEAIEKDQPANLGKYIKQGITPTIKDLMSLWFLAERRVKPTSLQWLSKSETLLDKVKATWPIEPTTYGIFAFHSHNSCFEHSLSNIQLLASLGINLMAVDRNNRPWIFEPDLAKNALTWLAKEMPGALECKFEGKTLRESLDSDKKAFVEKTILQRSLISRHKPLRNNKKMIKHRL